METVFQLRIDQDLKNKASQLAKDKGLNLSALIRMLLIEEIKKEGE